MSPEVRSAGTRWVLVLPVIVLAAVLAACGSTRPSSEPNEEPGPTPAAAAAPWPDRRVPGPARTRRDHVALRRYSSSQAPATRQDVALSWRVGCPVSWRDLTVVTVAYYGFDGARHTGRIVVHDNRSASVRAIFKRLYDNRFPIRRIHPVDVYGADDDRSMEANNTSAFNCRRVTGGSGWSEHSYGQAIDVNPVQNPYVRGSTVLPPAGRFYLDRRLHLQGMIHAGDATVRAFADHGWYWGGAWSSLKDYQHFSTTNR